MKTLPRRRRFVGGETGEVLSGHTPKNREVGRLRAQTGIYGKGLRHKKSQVFAVLSYTQARQLSNSKKDKC